LIKRCALYKRTDDLSFDIKTLKEKFSKKMKSKDGNKTNGINTISVTKTLPA